MSFRAYTVTSGESPAAATTLLEIDDLPSGEVLVAVEWSAVNYKDAMATVPGNRVARISPLVPGVDLAGTVEESTDPRVPVGSAVVAHGHDIGVARHGGFAEKARVPAAWVVPLPAPLTTRQAMVLGTAGFTAMLSVQRLRAAGVTPGGGPVLVTGAAGGVGSLSVAFLAAQGFEVVASTGRIHEREFLERLGAAEVVGRDAVEPESTRVLGPERWAGAVDCVGGATLAGVLRTLRYGGAVAASGLTGGTDLPTTVYPFIIRGVCLLGIDSVEAPADVRAQTWSDMAASADPSMLDLVTEGEVGLEGIGPALAAVLAGRIRGRMLVHPGA